MHAPIAPQWREKQVHLGRSGVILAFNQLLQIAIPFVTTTMTGRLGVDALAAGSMVGSIGLLLFITSLGVLQGGIPQLGMAIGAGDHASAVRAIRTSLAVALAMGLGTTAIMACVPWCLARAGQDPAVVDLAQRFILALLPGYLPGVLAIALRFTLIAANDLRWLNPIMIAGIAFNVGLQSAACGQERSGIDGLTAVGARDLADELADPRMPGRRGDAFATYSSRAARTERLDLPHAICWRAEFPSAQSSLPKRCCSPARAC